jgi:hypothetical protein
MEVEELKQIAKKKGLLEALGFIEKHQKMMGLWSQDMIIDEIRSDLNLGNTGFRMAKEWSLMEENTREFFNEEVLQPNGLDPSFLLHNDMNLKEAARALSFMDEDHLMRRRLCQAFSKFQISRVYPLKKNSILIIQFELDTMPEVYTLLEISIDLDEMHADLSLSMHEDERQFCRYGTNTIYERHIPLEKMFMSMTKVVTIGCRKEREFEPLKHGLNAAQKLTNILFGPSNINLSIQMR